MIVGKSPQQNSAIAESGPRFGEQGRLLSYGAHAHAPHAVGEGPGTRDGQGARASARLRALRPPSLPRLARLLRSRRSPRPARRLKIKKRKTQVLVNNSTWAGFGRRVARVPPGPGRGGVGVGERVGGAKGSLPHRSGAWEARKRYAGGACTKGGPERWTWTWVHIRSTSRGARACAWALAVPGPRARGRARRS